MSSFSYTNPVSAPQEASVSQWIADLKLGDQDAAQKLWQRYSARLSELARRKLGTAPKAVADEEDVAQVVFQSLCRGAFAGRLDDIKTRDDLWWILLALTRRKAVDHIRRENALKRGVGRVRQGSALGSGSRGSLSFDMDQLIGQEPTPEYMLIFEEQCEHLLGLLRDDRMRQIAVRRIEGYTIEEIAEQLRVSTRTVARKLRLIRNLWAKDLLDGP